ncbi:putative retrotransposon gag domain-containing protein [Helianthus annuus]|nr:putative retrotransposon gag domain-containing protein [Helianthus annuus]
MAPKRRNTRKQPNYQLPTTEAELEALLEQRIATAIAQYEANRVDSSGGTGGSGGSGPGGSGTDGNIVIGTTIPGCTYKAFLDCKPLNFNGSEGAVGFVRWVEKTESVIRISKCTPEQTVMYVTCLFLDEALTWWNLQVQTLGDEAAYGMTWEGLRELMREEYCSRAEIQRLETEFWNLTMIGADVAGYTQRFHDLSRVVPYLVTPEFKRIERYIWGLAPEIRSMVTSSHPATIRSAVSLAVSLTEDAVRMETLTRKGSDKKDSVDESKSSGKRKWSNFKKGNNATNQTAKNSRCESFLCYYERNKLWSKKVYGSSTQVQQM